MPKAFISYSWSSPGHQTLIREWADRLLADGVEIVLDQYDLREGQDKFAFMEQMVVDSSVTHVLIFSDKRYAEKADAREAGVGTESQIISREVYAKVAQEKFVPVACEVDENGEPYLPVFLKSRIWIDFRTPEAVNENWERLVRHLYGRPAFEKPAAGKPPVYLDVNSSPSIAPTQSRFSTLRQAVLAGKPGIRRMRADFLDHVATAIDELRTRERPSVAITGERILEDFRKLVPIRNVIIDWVLLEAETEGKSTFADDLHEFLERLVELKGRPADINSWQDTWFEAHELFAYETFQYIVAALLRTKQFEVLNGVLMGKYLSPQHERYGNRQFRSFTTFYAGSSSLRDVLAKDGRRPHSPAAALLKLHADRADITFDALLEADALLLLSAVASGDAHWFPQLLYYLPHGRVPPLFARAASKRHFRTLATVLGVASGDQVRQLWTEGRVKVGMDRWPTFYMGSPFAETLNLEHLDTI